MQSVSEQSPYWEFTLLSGEKRSFFVEDVAVNPRKQLWTVCLRALVRENQVDLGEIAEEIRRSFHTTAEVKVLLSCPHSREEVVESPRLLVEAIDGEESAQLLHASWKHDPESIVIMLREGHKLRRIDSIKKQMVSVLRDIAGLETNVNITEVPAPEAFEKVFAQPSEPKEAKGDPGGGGQPRFRRSPAPTGPALSGNVLLGKGVRGEKVSIGSLEPGLGRVVVAGEVFSAENRVLSSGKILVTANITDYTGSITVKVFVPSNMEKEDVDQLIKTLKPGQWIGVDGECQYDSFSNDMVLRAMGIVTQEPVLRQDNAEEKRVELHMHTQMSAMDCVASVESLLKTAKRWGHPAVAITDHGVVQAFPEAGMLGKKLGIKVILGMEAYMTAEELSVVKSANDLGFDQPFVVFDVETTGLEPHRNRVIEIGAVRVEKGVEVARFQTFVGLDGAIPAKIVHLTGITDDMLQGAPKAEEAMERFLAFAEGAALVAHNAPFDTGFIQAELGRLGQTWSPTVVDTLALSRALQPNSRSHKLQDVAKHLNVKLENHHRAMHDALCTAGVLVKMLDMLQERNINRLCDINTMLATDAHKAGESFHTILLVRNKTGLKNLYKLVSYGHLQYMYRGKPRLPKALIAQHREGLLVGSACEAGELYQSALRGDSQEALEKLAAFYDYLEIQPLGNNEFMVRNQTVTSHEALAGLNVKIVELGKRLQKPVVATGDVHFLEPQDEVYRRILMHSMKFADADLQAPLFFRTTQEMMTEHTYLPPEDQQAVVIGNPAKVADMCEVVDPLPDYKLYAPRIEGAEQDVVNLCMETAQALYGKPLPEPVQKRLDRELHCITTYGFSVLYLIAHKLVQKSLADDYLVGSRGSVGSSLVATMTGITEVNPLAPHYCCPECRYSDFEVDAEAYPCGPDLPDRACPRCDAALNKNGFDIPFEVFLGFEGDKVPDIDLNFSGEYQPVAHEYTEVLLGKGNVFRSGTIGTIADKTAYGFVANYIEEKGTHVTRAEIDRLRNGCTGVKRTTGQHPGGIIVVPSDMEVYDFTPIQNPADDSESGIITTHFDFDSLHDRLVKLDILGHDDPTMLRMLKDLTGLEPRSIPLDDPKTMSLFSSTEALNVTKDDIGTPMGTIGIPEFGTRFVRQMLEETKPTTMAELIRISGLSHGTDVWTNNAQDLVRDGVATLREAICTRDDIMNALITQGLEPKMAFDIMESVRKGKGLSPAMEEAMDAEKTPSWFIDSCKKIKYMFPKAHAAAYVTMAFRIAYYKVYYPLAYYTAYFTVRADEFDAGIMLGDGNEIRRQIVKMETIPKPNPREKSIVAILEVVLEMLARGFAFTNIDIYQSDAVKFLITPQGIRPPLKALPGLGITVAKSMQAAAQDGPFLSVEDLQKRAKVSKTVADTLREFHCLDGLSQTSQVSLFDLF